MFPNQIGFRDEDPSRGVLLNKMKWFVRPEEQDRFNMHFEMRLISDGPNIANIKDARRFKHTKNPPVLNYLGGGKYEIEPSF